MDRRSFIKSCIASGIAVASPAIVHPSSSEENRYNLLVITSDEHNQNMAGYLGHPIIKTPNLDKLAAEGTVFRHAYCACPVCTPSRASFITGKYVHQHHTWMNSVPTSPDEMTWPRRLTQAGYDTAAYGKMDLSGKYQNPGFSDFITFYRRAAFEPYPFDSPYDARLTGYVRSDKRRHISEAGSNRQAMDMLIREYGYNKLLFREENYKLLGFCQHDQEVTELGLHFLRKQRRIQLGKPWALYLGYIQPHWPYKVPDEYFQLYYPDRIKWPHDFCIPNTNLHPELEHFQKALGIEGMPDDAIRRTIAAYYGMITCLDDYIGIIIKDLKERGMYDNTYIIYTSDHGESLGEHGLFYKQCSYEGSVGVPLIIRGPGIPAGKQIDHPVSLIDEYATIMEMAGLLTESDKPGHSWLPMIRNDFEGYPEYVLSEFHGNFLRQSWYMLRRGNFKYTYYSNRIQPSLFNVDVDPLEMNDLAGEKRYEPVLKEFKDLLYSILDPEAVALQSKSDFGLIGPDSEDYTVTLTYQQLQNGRHSGKYKPRYRLGFKS